MSVELAWLIRHSRCLWWLVALGLVCLGSAPNRVCASQSAELTWTDSPDDNVVSYNVYFGTESGVYFDVTNCPDISDVIIPGLEDGTTYYFAVSAVDDAGNESELSNEAYYTVPPPAPFTLQVQGTTAAQTVQVSWTPSPESDVFGYIVEYGTQSGVYTSALEFDYTTDGIISGLVAGTIIISSSRPLILLVWRR